MLDKPKKLNMEIAAVSVEGYHWWKKCCEVWEAYHKEQMIKELEEIKKDLSTDLERLINKSRSAK